MRHFHLLRALALVGVLTAVGCTGTPATPTKVADFEPLLPQVVYSPTTQEAGEVDYAKTLEFTFPIENAGGAPLTLTLVKKNCDCAQVEVPGEINPGEKGTIKIRWKPIPGLPTLYTLTADVELNDPDTPGLRFQVRARIKPKVRVWNPPDDLGFIDFGDRPLERGEVKERELRVFSTELDAFTLQASATLPGLQVTTTPLPPTALVGGYQPRSGYSVVIRTTDKLPLGYVRDDLSLVVKTKEQEEWKITMPIYAVVGQGVFNIRPERIVFKKPQITDEDSLKVMLTFPGLTENEKVEVIEERTEPKGVVVVDKPERIRAGVWQVTVRLPGDKAQAARYQPDGFMEGRFVLRVTARQTAEVPVRVKWDPSEK
jgi:hypothetical protein